MQTEPRVGHPPATSSGRGKRLNFTWAMAALTAEELKPNASQQAGCTGNIHSSADRLLNPILPLLFNSKTQLWARESLPSLALTVASSKHS